MPIRRKTITRRRTVSSSATGKSLRKRVSRITGGRKKRLTESQQAWRKNQTARQKWLADEKRLERLERRGIR